MKTRRSNSTQARLEFVQDLVILVFLITAWATCLSTYLWMNGETPEAQLNGRVWTLIFGAVLFLIVLWEVWKTSPVHLHVVWHRHQFVAETEEYEPIPDGRRWVAESGMNDQDPHPLDPPAA